MIFYLYLYHDLQDVSGLSLKEEKVVKNIFRPIVSLSVLLVFSSLFDVVFGGPPVPMAPPAALSAPTTKPAASSATVTQKADATTGTSATEGSATSDSDSTFKSKATSVLSRGLDLTSGLVNSSNYKTFLSITTMDPDFRKALFVFYNLYVGLGDSERQAVVTQAITAGAGDNVARTSGLFGRSDDKKNKVYTLEHVDDQIALVGLAKRLFQEKGDNVFAQQIFQGIFQAQSNKLSGWYGKQVAQNIATHVILEIPEALLKKVGEDVVAFVKAAVPYFSGQTYESLMEELGLGNLISVLSEPKKATPVTTAAAATTAAVATTGEAAETTTAETGVAADTSTATVAASAETSGTATVKPVAKKETPDEMLFAAVDRGDEAGIESAIGKGADVNAKSASGDTPLIYAIFKGSPKIVSLLISRGANIHATRKNGGTPLSVAKWFVGKDAEAIRRLLEGKHAEQRREMPMPGEGGTGEEPERYMPRPGEGGAGEPPTPRPGEFGTGENARSRDIMGAGGAGEEPAYLEDDKRY